MTALDILCENQCENVYDEKSTDFQDHKIKMEEEFYRGGKAKWWNFYFSDQGKAKPFIKRDKYVNVMKMVKAQTKDPRSACVLLNLFSSPKLRGYHTSHACDVGSSKGIQMCSIEGQYSTQT